MVGEKSDAAYERKEDFLEVFAAAHPYLDKAGRQALVELAAAWASRAISQSTAAAPVAHLNG